MNALPAKFAFHLQHFLSADVKGFQSIGGGCINHAGCLQTSKGLFFLKWNDAHGFPMMFETEAKSLILLSKTRTVRIPEVIAKGETIGLAFLLLEYLPKDHVSNKSWERLGHELATMHRYSQASFGLGFDNYIGSLPQCNTMHGNWIDFFREERLGLQVKRAKESGKMSPEIEHKFELLYAKLPSLLPLGEKPALLHGDLWSGNVLMSSRDTPCLVDPASYFGNREAELAFTKLFGGFPDVFYSAYQESHPLPLGHEQRVDLYNLYPLLVHVNLFGGGYLAQIKDILDRYV